MAEGVCPAGEADGPLRVPISLTHVVYDQGSRLDLQYQYTLS